MATNPMQRKSRQSFLLGVVITLVIAAVIIFLLYNQIKTLREELNSAAQQKVQVYVLNQDVKSGQTLTADMFEMREVTMNAVPIDATNDIYTTLATYSLCDKQGNQIKTGVDTNGTTIMYIENDGKKNLIYQDETTGEYYQKTASGEKIIIETIEQPLIARVAMKTNTIITGSMIALSGDIQTDDVREQAYNMISLPIDLESGDYVDIRLMLPNGTDFIVLSKKKATVPENGDGPIADTIKINISEDEILTMSSAIVEAYKIEGSKLYAIKYIDAGNQETAAITYQPRADIVTLIRNDPNVVSTAMTSLYNNITNQYRENQINKYYDSGENESVVEGMEESTQKTLEDREEYLSSLYTVTEEY